MSAFLSESSCLRACNLPDTAVWRQWLRAKLPSQEISTGRIYDRAMVDLLAAKIKPVTGDIVLPPEPQRQAPAVLQYSRPVDSGRPKRSDTPLENRNGPALETR